MSGWGDDNGNEEEEDEINEYDFKPADDRILFLIDAR